MTTKKLTKKEVEKIVLDMYKEGKTSEKIGQYLKDNHGIKNFREEFGVKISQIIGKNDSDLRNVTAKLENLNRHFEKNKKDQPAKRRLMKTAAHLNKVKKYMSR